MRSAGNVRRRLTVSRRQMGQPEVRANRCRSKFPVFAQALRLAPGGAGDVTPPAVADRDDPLRDPREGLVDGVPAVLADRFREFLGRAP
jgi:hypothetical protein